MATDLSFVTSTEMVDELKKRYQTLVIIASDALEKDKNGVVSKGQLLHTAQGSPFEILGLLEWRAKQQTYDLLA